MSALTRARPAYPALPMLLVGWLAVGVMLCALAGTATASTGFGVESFESSIVNQEGEPVTQAGSHPYEMTTTIVFNHYFDGEYQAHHLGSTGELPEGSPKDIEVNLPPGVIVNPTATGARCTEAQLEHNDECPNAAAIGVVTADGAIFPEARAALYNMAVPAGVPAAFGFNIASFGVIGHVLGSVRTGGDYGLSAEVADITQYTSIYATTVTIWGDPSAESHDIERGHCADGSQGAGVKCPVERTGVPLISMPGSCTGEPLASTMSADSWQEPDRTVTASASSAAVTGCEALEFTPSITVKPDTTVADSPSGLSVDLRVPQPEGEARLAEANLRDAVVRLPAGMAVSPSAAAGLEACTPEEIGLSDASTPACPAASKLGLVKILTPLLEGPLEGSLYLAQQDDNPFGSLLALYLVAEGSGVLVKLAGRVELDPGTGQLTTRFEGNPPFEGEPQLPFSELQLNLFGGARAPLITPPACGTYTTMTQLTPWSAPFSGPSATPQDSFTITTGCGDGFAPSFSAGMQSGRAGAFSPLSVTFSRQDGEQRLGGAQVTLPPGLLGKIAGIPRCPEAQANSGECGESSQLGEATVAVGPGEDPYWVSGGKVYLTGPYNGGPFGLSIVVPTTAGPFTLTGNAGVGKEVVRASIRVNPATAQVTVLSDPFPTILQGIPLDIRTVNVTVNRPGFMFNPTNCQALSVAGTITSTGNATAPVSSPFEAANCATLPFAPKLTASVGAHASKANGTSFDVKLESAGIGQANIHKVDLQLPAALPSRLTTLQKACLAAVFESNPATCSPESVIGKATIHTPVLNSPLSGPAYLVSHGGAAFPDVEFVLQGEGVTLVLDGKTDIKNGITYSRFETSPDAPFTKFETELPAGPHSALTAYVPVSKNYNLCGTNLAMPTEITGQNGAVIKQTTKITITGCPPSVSITKTAVKGNAVLVTLKLGEGGTIKITGKGLKSTTKRRVKAGTHTITVPLTPAGRAAKKHKKKLKIQATLSVGARTGTATTTLKA